MSYHPRLGQIHRIPTPAIPNYSQSYNGHSGRATGWIQLSCAMGMLMVGVAQFLLGSVIRFFAMGIWTSLLCYGPAGILGIVSYRKRKKVISAYLVMSILSSVSACATMITCILFAIIDVQYCYISSIMSIPCDTVLLEAQKTSESLMAVIGLIETIVAIVASAYCCGVVCYSNQLSRQEFDVVNHDLSLSFGSTAEQGIHHGRHTGQPASTFNNIPQPQRIPQQRTLLHNQAYPAQQRYPQGQTYPHQQTFPNQQTNPQSYPQQQTFPTRQMNPQSFPQQQTHSHQTYPQNQNFPQQPSNQQSYLQQLTHQHQLLQTYPQQQTFLQQQTTNPQRQIQTSQIHPLQQVQIRQHLQQHNQAQITLPQRQDYQPLLYPRNQGQ